MKNISNTDWQRLKTMSDSDIDMSEIPELDDDFFRDAEVRLPKQGRMTLQLDADIVAWLKSQSSQHQQSINQLLRQYMEKTA